MKTPIYTSLYDIPQRLQEIDPTYFVLYDQRQKRYEVHSQAQKGNTQCFIVPYPQLDQRTLTYARQTRATNLAQTLAQMEQHNQKLQQSQQRKIIHQATQQYDRLLSQNK